ncbi:MAG: HipA domain-containing protein [Desulfovibrio sp.]|nr:HipA domain-containing protein [Desulfovibrio sp.]
MIDFGTPDILNVYIDGTHVGIIESINEKHTSLTFRYTDEWKLSGKGFPISLSMPFNGDFPARVPTNFFSNLFPEDNILERMADEANVKPYDLTGLLRAYGRDCAGAMVIVEGSLEDLPSAEPIDVTDRLAKAIEQCEPISTIPGRKAALAGQQDKLAVIFSHGADGPTILLPQDCRPTTHILKPYGAFCLNELICNRLAAACGFNVPKGELFASYGFEILATERYDRTKEPDSRRIHQEDFCQALGFSSNVRYGHSRLIDYRVIADFFRHHKFDAYLIDIVRIVAFNAIVGNGDAHAKNFSLLLSSKGVALAPFYDLCSTTAYNMMLQSEGEGETFAGFDESFAFPIGKANYIESITDNDLCDFAHTMGLSPNKNGHITSTVPLSWPFVQRALQIP